MKLDYFLWRWILRTWYWLGLGFWIKGCLYPSYFAALYLLFMLLINHTASWRYEWPPLWPDARIILKVWEDHPHSMGAHRADPPDQTRSALQCNGELTGYWPENCKQRSFLFFYVFHLKGKWRELLSHRQKLRREERLQLLHLGDRKKSLSVRMFMRNLPSDPYCGKLPLDGTIGH